MEGIDIYQMTLLSSKEMVPNIVGIRDRFCRRQFSTDQRWGVWFWDDSSTLHLLCTLFLILLYQLHLRSSGIRPQSLGTLL